MYYFRHREENLSYIDVKGKDFIPDFDQKVRVELSQKEILVVSVYDENGEAIPVKKSSELRKKIFNALHDEAWNDFIIDGEPIAGFSNEDGELVSYLEVLYPHKEKKRKSSQFEKYFSLLKIHQLPIFEDTDIIRKQISGEFLHLYYRINDNIYHVCINEFDSEIITKEIFLKTSS